MADDMEFRIARLEFEPGDILVCKGREPPRGSHPLRDLVPPGVRVLYLPADVDLSVLTKADIESRVAS